jgi:hypothetical protein
MLLAGTSIVGRDSGSSIQCALQGTQNNTHALAFISETYFVVNLAGQSTTPVTRGSTRINQLTGSWLDAIEVLLMRFVFM